MIESHLSQFTEQLQVLITQIAATSDFSHEDQVSELGQGMWLAWAVKPPTLHHVCHDVLPL